MMQRPMSSNKIKKACQRPGQGRLCWSQEPLPLILAVPGGVSETLATGSLQMHAWTQGSYPWHPDPRRAEIWEGTPGESQYSSASDVHLPWGQ